MQELPGPQRRITLRLDLLDGEVVRFGATAEQFRQSFSGVRFLEQGVVMEGPEGKNPNPRVRDIHLANCDMSQADGTEHVLPAGDTSLSVSVESYIEAYAPVDDNGNPIPCEIEKIVGVTFGYEKHPEITAGAPNYH